MRDDRDVTVIESDSGSGLKWFILGAALGAGAALLLAPQSGERTRRDLARRGRKLRAQAEGALDELSDGLQDRGRKLRETAEEFLDETLEAAAGDAGSGKRRAGRAAPSARDEMERRLADARTRGRAALGADGVAEDDDEPE